MYLHPHIGDYYRVSIAAPDQEPLSQQEGISFDRRPPSSSFWEKWWRIGRRLDVMV
jgi:hypothetical protein